MRKYLIYKTTCTINGKIYIGKHETDNIDDDYLGSGKVLRSAIKKYGRDAFEKEIIAIFDNCEDMNKLESVLVNEDFIARADTYNILCGGQGGFGYINRTRSDTNSSEIIRREKLKKFGKSPAAHLPKTTRESCMKGAKILWEKINTGLIAHPTAGLIHSEKTIQQMKKTHTHNQHQQGEKNSQYGKRWITHPEHGNRKIDKNDPIPEGWKQGRKIIWITHPELGNKMINKNDPIPDGWQFGRSYPIPT